MARYDYKCDNCNRTVTINKPMKEAAKEEYCELCETKMKRVYQPNHNKWNCNGSYARGSY